MVWIKVGADRRDKLLIGGIYRQHQLLGTQRNITIAQLLLEQEVRWKKIVSKWKLLSNNMNCIVIGDINLDHLRWSTPETHLENMVDKLKDSIETCGFHQLIAGITRTWRHQADSILDHIWSNCLERCLKTFNETRGLSDHNVIGVEISVREIRTSGNNIIKRIWRDFNQAECLNEFRNQDILHQDNVDIANSLLEDRICEIMDMFAPMRTVQVRASYNNFITTNTKECMKLRDSTRETARDSGLEADWVEYRRLKNSCTAKQRADKRNI